MPRSRGEKDDGKVLIRCSPNPSHGTFSLLLSDVPGKGANVRVHDRYGKVLVSMLVKDHITPLNMVRLAKGLYFVEVSINNNKQVMPVIIH
jgi:hypothetical protein